MLSWSTCIVSYRKLQLVRFVERGQPCDARLGATHKVEPARLGATGSWGRTRLGAACPRPSPDYVR